MGLQVVQDECRHAGIEWSAAVHDGLYALPDLVGCGRFQKVARGPQCDGPHDVGFVVRLGEDHDLGVGKGGQKTGQGIQAGHPRQVEVQQNEIGHLPYSMILKAAQGDFCGAELTGQQDIAFAF